MFIEHQVEAKPLCRMQYRSECENQADEAKKKTKPGPIGQPGTRLKGYLMIGFNTRNTYSVVTKTNTNMTKFTITIADKGGFLFDISRTRMEDEASILNFCSTLKDKFPASEGYTIMLDRITTKQTMEYIQRG